MLDIEMFWQNFLEQESIRFFFILINFKFFAFHFQNDAYYLIGFIKRYTI